MRLKVIGKMKLKSKQIGWFFLSLVSAANAAEPPYILVEQALSFGKIAVVTSTAVNSISIGADGKMTTGDGIYIIELGHPAEFLMVNYTPYTQYNISVLITDTETTTGAISSNQFTLKTIATPVMVTTDSKGEAVFSVGGTLETSGDVSKTYRDTLYQAKYMISLTY